MNGPPAESPRAAGDALLGELAGRRLMVVGLDPAASAGAAGWLDRLRVELSEATDLAAAASRSGPALAAAIFVAASRAARSGASRGDGGQGLAEPAFVVSVGDAVRRAVPTAARATLSARAPLRGGLTEAQVGGPFGRAFAGHADALVLLGGAPEPSVVEIQGCGAVRVLPAPARLLASGASERARALSRPGGGVHVMATGPGAQVGLPFANLARFDGDEPGVAPSVVGRGGLGASLARAAVVALTVEEAGDPGGRAAPAGAPDGDLEAALVRSPRLLTRAAGGTLELAASRGSSVDVAGPRRKHGCAGCPTPCGWSFDVDVRGGAKVGGRFSALQGFAGRGDPLALLERCNHIGVDARTAASLMGRFPGTGVDQFFTSLLEPGSEVHAAAMGAVGLPGVGATFAAGDLAAEVGQALGVRGPEPVRTLSILGLEGDRAGQVVWPLPWSGDPERDAGTLAFWHECISAAVDVSGFCSFSAAGLLADRVMGVRELAAALGVAPEGSVRSGERGEDPDLGPAFIRSGASHLALHRELQEGGDDFPAEFVERHPAAVEAYLVARAMGGREGTSSGAPAVPPRQAPDLGRAATEAAAGGPLTVLARGPLGARLAGHPGRVERTGGEGVVLEVLAPAGGLSGQDLMLRLAVDCPAAAQWLLDAEGRPLPAVLEVESGSRSGTHPAQDGRYRPGAVVELMLAIPGG